MRKTPPWHPPFSPQTLTDPRASAGGLRVEEPGCFALQRTGGRRASSQAPEEERGNLLPEGSSALSYTPFVLQNKGPNLLVGRKDFTFA